MQIDDYQKNTDAKAWRCMIESGTFILTPLTSSTGSIYPFKQMTDNLEYKHIRQEKITSTADHNKLQKAEQDHKIKQSSGRN